MLVNFLMLLRVLYHILTKDIQDRKDSHLYISLCSMFAVFVF